MTLKSQKYDLEKKILSMFLSIVYGLLLIN